MGARVSRLTRDEVRALTASACADDGFEPFVGRIVDAEVLERVVASGLVETGPSCRPAVGQIGYRLTDKGWTKFKRASLSHGLAT